MASQISTLVVMQRPRALSLLRSLEACSANVAWVPTRKEFQRALRNAPDVEVVLTDVTLPDGDWREVLEEVRSRAEVIVCVSKPERSFYCEVIQTGAYDVLSEPEDPANLRQLLRAASARRQMRLLSTAATSATLPPEPRRTIHHG